jgi:hypothetical protein
MLLYRAIEEGQVNTWLSWELELFLIY